MKNNFPTVNLQAEMRRVVINNSQKRELGSGVFRRTEDKWLTFCFLGICKEVKFNDIIMIFIAVPIIMPLILFTLISLGRSFSLTRLVKNVFRFVFFGIKK